MNVNRRIESMIDHSALRHTYTLKSGNSYFLFPDISANRIAAPGILVRSFWKITVGYRQVYRQNEKLPCDYEVKIAVYEQRVKKPFQ